MCLQSTSSSCRNDRNDDVDVEISEKAEGHTNSSMHESSFHDEQAILGPDDEEQLLGPDLEDHQSHKSMGDSTTDSMVHF